MALILSTINLLFSLHYLGKAANFVSKTAAIVNNLYVFVNLKK